MSNATSFEAVMRKALDILRTELSREEYLVYLEAIMPKVGDATEELRNKSKTLELKTILEEARKSRGSP